MANVYGIDVSKWQGTIDWSKMATELKRVNGNKNPGFVIIKVGNSTMSSGFTLDGQFKKNVAGAEKYGIPYGFYYYSYDQSTANATKGAQAFIQQIKVYKPSYPVYIDMEYEQYNIKCGKAANTAMLKAACAAMEAAGYYAGIYCSRNFFQTYTNLNELTAYTLWEAGYTSSDTTAVKNDIWQYSSKNALKIAGFGSSLDCNVAYKDFPSIIKKAGLNGWPKGSTGTTTPTTPTQPSTPASTCDWNSSNNDFVVTCSKGDRAQLKALCDKLQLPVRNA